MDWSLWNYNKKLIIFLLVIDAEKVQIKKILKFKKKSAIVYELHQALCKILDFQNL